MVRRRPRRVPQSGTAAGGPTFICGGRGLGRPSRTVPRLARRVQTRRRREKSDAREEARRKGLGLGLRLGRRDGGEGGGLVGRDADGALEHAVLAALAKTSEATPAIQLHRFVLVVLGLIAATFYRYSWSFLQTRPPVERDIFLMASDAVQATQDALRRLISTHGEATSLIDVEAQPDLAQRFLARSESVKNYWRSQLETIMSVPRAPSPTPLPRTNETDEEDS